MNIKEFINQYSQRKYNPADIKNIFDVSYKIIETGIRFIIEKNYQVFNIRPSHIWCDEKNTKEISFEILPDPVIKTKWTIKEIYIPGDADMLYTPAFYYLRYYELFASFIYIFKQYNNFKNINIFFNSTPLYPEFPALLYQDLIAQKKLAFPITSLEDFNKQEQFIYDLLIISIDKAIRNINKENIINIKPDDYAKMNTALDTIIDEDRFVSARLNQIDKTLITLPNIEKLMYKEDRIRPPTRLEQEKFQVEQSRFLKDKLHTDMFTINQLNLVASSNFNRFDLTDLHKDAEEEYIIQNLVKEAIKEVYKYLKRLNQFSIAVRPTSMLAHMGIEAGNPTKPVFIKNKSSKDEDVILNPEIKKENVGAIVHYNPFKDSPWCNRIVKVEDFIANQEQLWSWKLLTINGQAELSIAAKESLKSLFISRSIEFIEEDALYKTQDYKNLLMIRGPFLYVREKPYDLIYGDHDLFCFADSTGRVPLHEDVNLLAALKSMPTFSAQHGGIYYWIPKTRFEESVKNKIMFTHTLEGGGEPLIVITPTCVKLCFYEEKEAKLISVWHEDVQSNINSWKWLNMTSSGRDLLRVTGKMTRRGGIFKTPTNTPNLSRSPSLTRRGSNG